MNTSTAGALTSIIVPCYNQVAFTQLCLQALFRFTRPAWELIVIDNGSTDGTGLYLAGVRDAATVPVTVIRNERNQGFPRAANQGLQAASGEYLVLLNNDAVVTDGWLDQLIALSRAPVSKGENGTAAGISAGSEGPIPTAAGTDRPAAIGLVGPMSNYASPPQLVENVPYRNLDEMHGFATRWRDEHRGQWFTAGKLSGFCLLMKRAVYDAVGGLDERFGLGFFDDDDLAVRARRAGFALAVANDLFVHHFGSRTYANDGTDIEGLLEQNARRFAEKWGASAPVGRRVALRPWKGAGAGGNRREAFHAETPRSAESAEKSPGGVGSTPPLGSRARRMNPARVSLTMIVRDEEENLPRCLASVRGVFDEIVVVDTGSVDRTREIAREFGAKVFAFAWTDDFAAARNAALEHATGDYAFWLDADDVVEPDQREKLVALLEGLPGVDRAFQPDAAGDGPDGVGRAFQPDAVGNGPDGSDAIPAGKTERRGGSEPRQAGKPDRRQAGKPDRRQAGKPDRRQAGKPDRRQAGKPDRRQAGKPDRRQAYVVRCACDPGEDGSGGRTVVDHVRLFPLRPDVRWAYRVHEQIMPALRRAGIPVRWTDLVVRHTGYADVALRARKLQRDTRILLEELKDRPDEPFILFNLGAIAVEQKDWPAALEYLKKSLAHSAPTDSITRKLFALIARAHQMLGDSGAAIRVCADGLALDPDDAELWFRKAVVHRHRGESREAESCWRRILTLTRPEKFASVDMGIYGHLTRRNLAALAAERGDREEEHQLWADVLAECPGDPEAGVRLGRLARIE